MHVTQILPIVLRGASVFQGPTQMTRVDRLASSSSYTREPQNMADVSVAGLVFSETPPTRLYTVRTNISNPYIRSAGPGIH